MSLPTVPLGPYQITRLIIGGNPFSGFAHQTPEKSDEMKHWYTVARIKDALRRAEELGVAAHLRPIDAVCIGVYTRDNPDMLAQDARILEERLRARARL